MTTLISFDNLAKYDQEMKYLIDMKTTFIQSLAALTDYNVRAVGKVFTFTPQSLIYLAPMLFNYAFIDAGKDFQFVVAGNTVSLKNTIKFTPETETIIIMRNNGYQFRIEFVNQAVLILNISGSGEEMAFDSYTFTRIMNENDKEELKSYIETTLLGGAW